MGIDEIDGNEGHDGHIYRIKKIDKIQEIFAERDKRNVLSTKYNRGVNIISVFDNCLGVTAIGLGNNWSWSYQQSLQHQPLLE